MLTKPLHSANSGRLRREYFQQDEAGGGTPPHRAARMAFTKERGFTLHGHRLSSLFRNSNTHRLTLMLGEFASSCSKYSAGVWGCKTPAPTPANRRHP